MQLLNFLGDALDNSPTIKFIGIDELGVYEALDVPGSAMEAIFEQLNHNGLVPNGDAVNLSDHVKLLDLKGIFDDEVTKELCMRMHESLRGPELRDWISIKYFPNIYPFHNIQH